MCSRSNKTEQMARGERMGDTRFEINLRKCTFARCPDRQVYYGSLPLQRTTDYRMLKRLRTARNE
jgi:hypothetical protein